MYSNFYINKQSGTYSETLEAYGLGNLLYEILHRNNVSGIKITIEDLGYQHLIKTNKPITEAYIDNLPFFQIFKFIKKEVNQSMPTGIAEYFDYPANKAIQDDYKAKFAQIEKLKSEGEKKAAKKALNEEKLSEFGKSMDPEFDVYREAQGNINYPNFLSLFSNYFDNKLNFKELIRLIIVNYSDSNFLFEKIKKLIPDSSSTFSDFIKPVQLYNPNQGKGNNKIKANGFDFSKATIQSNWISESMKISGALSYMVCQYVKVGSSYDMKIYVPEFNQVSLKGARDVLTDFKKYLKSTSPIKLDILNILDFTAKFIKYSEEYNGKVNKTLKGFHSVYQKDLGQNKAVANIAFINTPDFVEYNNQEEALEWIEILEQQRNLISNIKELGDSMQGLQAYRNFLGSIGNMALDYFSHFSYWYGNYLMQQLTKGNKFVRTFKIEHLNKFYQNMSTQELNLTEIIKNDGFEAVAKAIRKSTVSLQYTPKDQRKFEIRYGLAQQLQNKAKSKEDLATFIGEFIGTYNAETARNAEKNGGKPSRANVKDEELIQFYSLLDKNPPRLIGALLSSYGFALNKKEAPESEVQDDENNQEEN
ncbi:hypothetical protein DC498_10615 [Terrimonas sp.]|uniref:hypothetical protein n=1 Tax=Terrimonas sp. TaxID=1914338 RepID=UPI000D51D7BE|nr:hypothetical protein [Terrimonas sp.]PVD52173.1 hypothetical protein DC498_10615 [Terrimonas sp.]